MVERLWLLPDKLNQNKRGLFVSASFEFVTYPFVIAANCSIRRKIQALEITGLRSGWFSKRAVILYSRDGICGFIRTDSGRSARVLCPLSWCQKHIPKDCVIWCLVTKNWIAFANRNKQIKNSAFYVVDIMLNPATILVFVSLKGSQF